ncbi:MAG TPA: DUF3159 domain-containing protein [Actinomycetaceae bacterium]|nr:DUF3159 domain-containing protein [Actinomycetaceae bacterium]
MSTPVTPGHDEPPDVSGGPVAGPEPPQSRHEAPEVAAAAEQMARGSFAQLTAEDFDVMESMGGVRGLAESILPGLVFVVVFVATRELMPALIAASALAVIAFTVRLVARQSVTMALGGVFGVAIGVVWAWRSGDAADFFVWGLIVNAAYLVGVLASILAKWPVVGVIVALLRGRWEGWRTSAAYPRYVVASWLWVGLFAGRLAVQLPLYLGDSVGWLGTARLIMGTPLFALVLWLTWLLVREPAPAASPARTPRQ